MMESHSAFDFSLCKMVVQTGGVPQGLRALVVLAEDLDSIPSPHIHTGKIQTHKIIIKILFLKMVVP